MRRSFLVVAVAALAACKSSSPPEASPPEHDSGPSTPTADAALSFDFGALEKEEFGGSWKTEGLVVMHAGQIVYEKYAKGWTAAMPHILYSASKSIGSALVGLAIADGLMARSDSVCKFVTAPSGSDPKLCDTTIDDLLHMGSGLHWVEDDSDPSTSNVLEMLYGNQTDMGGYAASQPRVADAGALFVYSSGDADILALAFKGALKGQDARTWAQTKLFGPAGITSATFESDRSGTLVFSSSCFLTPRDFAKFGQLYLDDGMVGATRVLPAGWVAYSITPAPPVSTPASRLLDAGAAPGGSYGAQWWLNAATPTSTSDTWEYPNEPVDGYNAEGHYGQKLAIIPSRQLVVARVGNDRAVTFVPDAMIKAAVAAVDAATHGGG